MTYSLYKWLKQQKKEMETDADGYLTEERAAMWRLNAEKLFTSLAAGSSDRMPSSVRGVCDWLFSRTTAENRIGEFGKWVLKSGKMARKDHVLNRPIDDTVMRKP
jgi:hypothetical protein